MVELPFPMGTPWTHNPHALQSAKLAHSSPRASYTPVPAAPWGDPMAKSPSAPCSLARGACSRIPHLRLFYRASHKHFSAHVHHLRIIPFPKPSLIQSVKKIPPSRSDLASIIFFTLFNPTSASKSTQPSISPCPPRPPPSASTARNPAQLRAHTNSARTWQQCSKIFAD